MHTMSYADDPRRVAGADVPTAPIPAVDVALRDAFERHGAALLGDRAWLERELVERFDAPPPDVALVLAAFDEQVPQALSSVEAIEDVAGMMRRLEKRLRVRRGLNGYAAAWVVGAWARAVAARTEGPAALPSVRSGDPRQAPGNDGFAARVPRAAGTDRRGTAPGTASATRRRRVGALLVGVACAVATAIALVVLDPSHDEASRRDRRPSTARRAADAPRATVTGPLPTARPPPRIVGIVTTDPLPGDGHPHEVYVAFADGRSDVARIESRFVRGDGAWDAAPRSVELDDSAVDRGTASAGPIALATDRPAHAVFEYVAVTRDGGRSAPFVKAFDFVPVVDCPPDACGTVVRSRPVQPAPDEYAAQVPRALAIPLPTKRERDRASHDVTVRLDDRTTRVVRRAEPLVRGTRVRLVDGRLVVTAGAASLPSNALSTAGERR